MEKKYFNKTQINKLQKSGAVAYFETIIKTQVKRGTSHYLDDLVADIYRDATGEEVARNWSCNKCCYNLYKKAANLYYSSLEILQDNDNQEDKENKSQIKNKRGRNGKSKPESKGREEGRPSEG